MTAPPPADSSDSDRRLLIVVSGPGGAGKGTLVAELLRRDPRLWLSRSWTTRPQRPGEPDDAYVFVTRERFERHLASGGFLEWAEFLGNLYGTPMPEVGDRHDIVLEIDVQGARQVRVHHADALLVFVDAPSRDEQLKRLRQRGDTHDHARARIAKADEEAGAAAELGASVVVNDDLDRAVSQVHALIEAARRL